MDLQTIRWSDKAKGFRYTYLTPPVAQQYLLHFDQGVKCRPFSFNLRGAQTSSVRIIERRNGKIKEKLRHRLGRKRLLSPDAGSPPEVYGGGVNPASSKARGSAADAGSACKPSRSRTSRSAQEHH